MEIPITHKTNQEDEIMAMIFLTFFVRCYISKRKMTMKEQ